MESLPFSIDGNTNPSIKVGTIILMDGVAVHANKPTVSVSQTLQL